MIYLSKTTCTVFYNKVFSVQRRTSIHTVFILFVRVLRSAFIECIHRLTKDHIMSKAERLGLRGDIYIFCYIRTFQINPLVNPEYIIDTFVAYT